MAWLRSSGEAPEKGACETVRATQCSEFPVYVQLLRNDHLSLLYTGLPLDAFTSLGDDLTEDFNNGFHLHPRDQLLMTLMKLRLNLLQDDIAERFHVSQPCKPHNLDSRAESYCHYYGQNIIKFLIAVAPCGLIMLISPGYGGR
ncbi:hypothetical protein ACEWY4_003945 [Coilia grayii]|uniref:Transposase Helix-turn-helix domain-containing protein n=1 Tax=Coilia grayii TaxID=363190 RepID=A0ABD1KK46_9TELE